MGKMAERCDLTSGDRVEVWHGRRWWGEGSPLFWVPKPVTRHGNP